MKRQSTLPWCALGLVISIGFTASQAQESCDGVYGKGPNKFSVATGSPGELGILKALGEAFAAKADTTLLWKKAGSGESLKALKE